MRLRRLTVLLVLLIDGIKVDFKEHLRARSHEDALLVFQWSACAGQLLLATGRSFLLHPVGRRHTSLFLCEDICTRARWIA